MTGVFQGTSQGTELTRHNTPTMKTQQVMDGHPGRAGGSADCLVCGAGLGPSRLPGLLRCPACWFITADVEMTGAEHKALYGPDYFHGEEYADYLLEEASLKENFRGRLETLLRFTDAPAATSLFEIGCAYGFFLDVAREHFASVAGIDIAEDAVAHARDTLDLDAVAGDVLEHEFKTAPDLVCMWDVIEHLARPDNVLARVSEAIAPDGLVAITTGDIGSLNARFRGRNWRMIHPPTHLHYFSRATLGRLLDEKGFDVVHVEYPGVVCTIGQILYGVLVLRQQMQGLYDSIERLPFLDRKISLNLFDIMFVIARKRADGESAARP